VKHFVFSATDWPDLGELLHTLETVAQGTDTEDLVVALYLLPGKHASRGTAFVHQWSTSNTFLASRGRWAFCRRFGAPDGLPERFKLIRMRLDGNRGAFPRTERDSYHWEFQYRTLSDQLALLFAHELHHYRRHHLHLHLRGGEKAANVWALHHVQGLGFCVQGKPLPVPRKRFSPRRFLFSRLPHLDPYADFRTLEPGNRLIVRRDPGARYQGQSAVLMRPARADSKRLVIQTSDGELWRWPMEWLDIQ